jgi:hypothetical protein
VSAERRRLLVAALVFVTALGVYAPARHLGFVDYDDDIYVTENPHLADGFGWDDVRRSFAEPYETNWIPLTWISLGLDRSLYCASPAAITSPMRCVRERGRALPCAHERDGARAGRIRGRGVRHPLRSSPSPG